MSSQSSIRDVILALLHERGVGKSICPSEAARALDADGWRTLMEAVRNEAASMARRGELIITQGDAVLEPDALRGPIRLRLPPDAGST